MSKWETFSLIQKYKNLFLLRTVCCVCVGKRKTERIIVVLSFINWSPYRQYQIDALFGIILRIEHPYGIVIDNGYHFYGLRALVFSDFICVVFYTKYGLKAPCFANVSFFFLHQQCSHWILRIWNEWLIKYCMTIELFDLVAVNKFWLEDFNLKNTNGISMNEWCVWKSFLCLRFISFTIAFTKYVVWNFFLRLHTI